MKWVKFNHLYLDQTSIPFYFEISDDQTTLSIKNRIAELEQQHYRNKDYLGIQYEVVDTIPDDMLKTEIERCESSIEWNKKRLKELLEFKESAKQNV